MKPLQLPQPVFELLQTTFPNTAITQITTTIGGYSNLTIALMLNDQPYILKAANTTQKQADLQRESLILPLLAETVLPIAKLYSALATIDWFVIVLQRLPGINGIHYLTQPDASSILPDPQPLFAQLGDLLSQVHQIQLPALIQNPLFSLAIRAQATATSLTTLGLPEDRQALLQECLNRLATSPRQAQLIHGDPGAHNLLWADQITGLLDWEWAALGDPFLDLAWVCWTIRFRQLPETVRAAFLDAYGSACPQPDELRSLVLAQIAMILVRVQQQPSALAEWLRRLEWTLALTKI